MRIVAPNVGFEVFGKGSTLDLYGSHAMGASNISFYVHDQATANLDSNLGDSAKIGFLVTGGATAKLYRCFAGENGVAGTFHSFSDFRHSRLHALAQNNRFNATSGSSAGEPLQSCVLLHAVVLH